MGYRIMLIAIFIAILEGCVTSNKNTTDGFITNELVQAGVIAKQTNNQKTMMNE